MSICAICKYYKPLETYDENAELVSLNSCHAKVSRRHWWLRKIFREKYIYIFSKEMLYPNQNSVECSYFKSKINKYNFGAY